MSFQDNLKKVKKDARDTLIPVHKTKQEDVTSNSNQDDVTKNVTQTSNITTETFDETSKGNTTVSDVKQNLLSMYEEKTKKETVEDTHVRSTFLFRKDLSKRLDKLAKGKRGFKTMFLNNAIEALLDEMEKK